MPRPQNEEEATVMDKILWDFMMKKTLNNVTYFNENFKIADILVAGETKVSDEDRLKDISSRSREQECPKNGEFQVFDPLSGNYGHAHPLSCNRPTY